MTDGPSVHWVDLHHVARGFVYDEVHHAEGGTAGGVSVDGEGDVGESEKDDERDAFHRLRGAFHWGCYYYCHYYYAVGGVDRGKSHPTNLAKGVG